MASVATNAPPASGQARRCVIALEGMVQGIGVRPSIYRLAVGRGLAGSVRNTHQGVLVDVEGEETALRSFLADLRGLTPAARVAATWPEPQGLSGAFSIESSDREGVPTLSPVADLATCDACLRDLTDVTDRRHRYPFVTCASCGPRFTIVHALPYDRERTTMAAFTMCEACRTEYENAADRRLHAETTSCHACGPFLALRGAAGESVSTADPIDTAANAIVAGAVVAIKGIGGYHVACDATNQVAIAQLRQRKRRDAKPLAVMVKDLGAAHAVCRISEAEAKLLTSVARPIVLLARHADSPVADNVAPGMRSLGIMLPYAPLHHLLLDAVDRPLVMTSGNATDEPIAHVDDDALSRLRDVVDLFVTHDRPIHVPCDDSVAQVIRHVPRLIRRSRGYVPEAIALPVAASQPILACGGELKNTVALVRGGEAFLSQHLGDLTSEYAFRGYLTAIEHLEHLLAVTPGAVAHDLHPAYRATLYAKSLEGVQRVVVQHHHAHIAACLADNGVDERVVGVAWDGTGYGLDGNVWGGEFLVADLNDFTRVGHLEHVPLPGGDAAVREPWRMAAAFLRAAYGEAVGALDLNFVRRLDRSAWRVLDRAIESGLNAPMTSSAGRLFDGVASLLGLRDRVTFEGQAAMELEALAERDSDRIYRADVINTGGTMVVRTSDVIRGVVDDLLAAVPASRIAARFHATLVDIIVRVCAEARQQASISTVALSGGVFQNAWLLTATVDALEARGFTVYTHRRVPTNDGGLALGQAAVAARRLGGGA